MSGTTTATMPPASSPSYGFRKLLGAVPVERLANDWGAALRPHGDEQRGFGVCHGGDNPMALLVQPGKARWWCYRNNEGGDVLDLYMALRRHNDKTAALLELAGEYGVEGPARPPSYYAKQERQRPARERIRAARVEVLRRRLFRYTMLPLIKATAPDEDEFCRGLSRAWEDFRGVPVDALLGSYDHLGGA
jgi:hypothetical protein